MIFYPKTTATFISTFIYMSMLATNMMGLFLTASAGVIVNHMVRILAVNVFLGKLYSPPGVVT